jgi:hypothetical protein
MRVSSRRLSDLVRCLTGAVSPTTDIARPPRPNMAREIAAFRRAAAVVTLHSRKARQGMTSVKFVAKSSIVENVPSRKIDRLLKDAAALKRHCAPSTSRFLREDIQ